MLHFTVLPYDVRGLGVLALVQDREVAIPEAPLDAVMQWGMHFAYFMVVVHIAKEILFSVL